MIKLFYIFIFSFFYLNANAQLYVGGVPLDSLLRGKYVEVCSTPNVAGTWWWASVDYGQGRPAKNDLTSLFYLTDEQGELKPFKSYVAILNLMIENGYKTHTLGQASGCNLYFKTE